MQQCFLTYINVNVKQFTCPKKIVVTPEFCMMARPGDSAEAASQARQSCC